MKRKKYIASQSAKGALLLELLIVISLLAIILSVGSQAVFVSLQSSKISGERDVAVGLASEALEATRGVAEEKWQNVFGLTKGSQYHPVSSGNKWILTASSENIALNSANYTRYIVIQNVCREADPNTRNVTGITDTNGTLATCTASGGVYDPSTQKVVVTVSWPNADPVTISEYFLRWRNKVCQQTDWSGGASSGAKNCPDTTYGGIDPAGEIDTSGGTLKLQ